MVEPVAANRPSEPNDGEGNLLALAALSLIAGAAAGAIGAVFRLALEEADRMREELIARTHVLETVGCLLLIAACAAATALAAWLVRRFSPHASGSGIPHVEAVLDGKLPPASLGLVVIKFVGGVLAIGAGLALGREGPSVQMGAGVSHAVGKAFRRNWTDGRVLLAAGAGAGLATAFNAPIAGAIFVLEELDRRFEIRIAIAALGASATAITVSRAILGDAPDFTVAPLRFGGGVEKLLFFALGVVAGLLAIAYSRTLLASLALVARLKRWPVELRAGLVGGLVGLVAWYQPTLVGGGEALTERTLNGGIAIKLLPLVLLLRFGLGAASYAAKTPGGLFAPRLVLGAQLGLLFGAACRWGLPSLDVQPEAFAVVGMAAFFTGVVRAPITGILLITEMTGSFTMLLPMLGACFTAMLVPTLTGDRPIYDSLAEVIPPQPEAIGDAPPLPPSE